MHEQLYLRLGKGDEIRRLDEGAEAMDRGAFGRQVVGVDGGEEGGGGDVLEVVPWLKPEEASRGFVNIIIGAALLKARAKELLTLRLEICPHT